MNQYWYLLPLVVTCLAEPNVAVANNNVRSETANERTQTSAPSGAEALRVFLDCGRCDTDFLRREILFVNYVRDRPDAQVHVLVTIEGTGGGGAAWTLDFYGLEEFEGMDDQLMFYTSQDDTDDSRRRVLARTLSLGLVRYAIRHHAWAGARGDHSAPRTVCRAGAWQRPTGR